MTVSCVHQSPAQGPLEAVGGEPRTAKLGPASHLRLLVILVPTISLLLFVLVLTGRTAAQTGGRGQDLVTLG